jgi:glutathione S-transferase
LLPARISRENPAQEAFMKFELYFSPGSCPRVTMIALEETGAPFETHLVAFMAGEHRNPGFLARNPSGKVPVLLVDGQPIVQTVAILGFLDEAFPEAALFPKLDTPLSRAQFLGDLVSFSADLHPIVTRIAFPQIMIDHAEGAVALRAKALETMAFQLTRFEARLEHQPWVAGQQWSVLDAYLHWVWFRITGAGFDPVPFPGIVAHYARTLERPSVQRALAREAKAVQDLESRGLMPRPRA